MQKKKIIYAADENFIKFALISIKSAILNGNINFDFHIIHSQEQSKLFKEMTNSLDEHQDLVKLISVDSRIFSTWKQNSSLTTSAYLRLLIPDIFCEDEKVLYIDSDTLVLKSLNNIFEQDISQTLIAGVLDDNFGNSSAIKSRPNYINSGVLLLNCKKLAKDSFLEKTKIIYENFKDMVIYHDQCLINFYTAGNVNILPPHCNKMIRAGHITTDEWMNTLSSGPSIIHYLGPVKPWMNWSNQSVTSHWLAYASLAGYDHSLIRKPQTAFEKLLQAKSYEQEGNFQKASELKTEIISLLSSQ